MLPAPAVVTVPVLRSATCTPASPTKATTVPSSLTAGAETPSGRVPSTTMVAPDAMSRT